MRSHGPTHSLVIHDVRPEDQGTYCCQAGQDSAHTRLLVEARRPEQRPPPPSPATALRLVALQRPGDQGEGCCSLPHRQGQEPLDESGWEAG
ncbi:hypothetical protein P7K49_013567 [Saguinus oedipus]|uniref:Uncharacterized protein n=1 Tax=Saguinus oedipus TaxID=9490 RepID=A0ABQ9VGP3_SAGOE|nr:hypothetical protein P7K49_013567 [Saguinus oedipus]